MVVAPPDRRAQEAAGRPARHAVYVWELPVRLVHWTIVLALLILSVTGYYIYDPFLPGSGSHGHPGFLMGDMRFVHEATGFVFIAAVIVRIYWAFAGNRYAHWRALIIVSRKQLRDLGDTVRFYAFRRRNPPRMNGHNPLEASFYVFVYLCFVVTALTGLGLFAWETRSPTWVWLFGWTWTVMPVADLRLLHFLLMFWYAAFAVHHIYAAILIDVEERNGELSSIITGWKADQLEGEQPRDAPAPP